MHRVLSFLTLFTSTVFSAHALTEVPLLKSWIPDGDGYKWAYGIYAKVGIGGEARLFQLDTGNGSFQAGYAAEAPPSNQFWGSGVTAYSSDQFHIGFGSGIEMDFHKVNAQVTISNASGADLAVIPQMALGQVYAAHGDDLPTSSYWHDQLVAGDAPLHQTYYGNFGAGIYQGTGSEGATLYSALGQIEGLTGFALSFSGTSPTLTLVFDNPEDQSYVDSYTYAAALSAPGGSTFPVTGWDTHSEFPTIAASYAVNGITVSGTNGVFDTGGTSFGLTDEAKTALEGTGLLDGDDVIAGQDFAIGFTGAGEVDGQTFGDFTLNFTTGTEEGQDLVTTNTGSSQLNYGPAIYNYYDVYYDLQNNLVRFRAVPEPGALGLAGLAAVLLSGGWLWRKQRKS